MIVPTVPATTARRNCRLCSASVRVFGELSVVVIECPSLPLICRGPNRLPGLKPVVFLRDVLVRVIREQRGRGDADNGASKDIECDREARSESGKQCRSDKWRWAAGNNRGKLVA